MSCIRELDLFSAEWTGGLVLFLIKKIIESFLLVYTVLVLTSHTDLILSPRRLERDLVN